MRHFSPQATHPGKQSFRQTFPGGSFDPEADEPKEVDADRRVHQEGRQESRQTALMHMFNVLSAAQNNNENFFRGQQANPRNQNKNDRPVRPKPKPKPQQRPKKKKPAPKLR